jgi:NTP pyrophosphatase (non-canonical NTP hydrolase)
MMTRTQFLLLKLSEECVEVAQRAAKQMQFGRNEIQKDQSLTNSERLVGELRDLAAVVNLLEKEGELPRMGSHEWDKGIEEKYEKWKSISGIHDSSAWSNQRGPI